MGGVGSRAGCKPSDLQLTLMVHVPNNWVRTLGFGNSNYSTGCG